MYFRPPQKIEKYAPKRPENVGFCVSRVGVHAHKVSRKKFFEIFFRKFSKKSQKKSQKKSVENKSKKSQKIKKNQKITFGFPALTLLLLFLKVL